MGRISSKTLTTEDTELDELLEEEEEVESSVIDEDEEEEEIIPVSKKRRLKAQQKKRDSFSVTLTGAATYYIDGMLFKRNESQELPLSKLPAFKNNGWFTIRY